MPELQTQIEALREAFSADTSRPFELKSSFPYGSPLADVQPSPLLDAKYQNQFGGQVSSEQPAQVQYHPQPLTPPILGNHEDRDRPITTDPLGIMANGQQLSSTPLETDQAAWNPTPIFEYGSDKQKHKVSLNTNKSNSQWTTAFETPSSIVNVSSNLAQSSSPLYTPTALGSHDLPPLNDAMQQQQYSASLSMAPLSRMQSVLPQPSYTSAGPSFVTSSMWRDTVASTFDPEGLKRRCDMESSFLIDPVQQKRSR